MSLESSVALDNDVIISAQKLQIFCFQCQVTVDVNYDMSILGVIIRNNEAYLMKTELMEQDQLSLIVFLLFGDSHIGNVTHLIK